MQTPVAAAGDNRLTESLAPCIKNSSAMAAVVKCSKKGTKPPRAGKRGQQDNGDKSQRKRIKNAEKFHKRS
jgi:hypothetical protein